MTKKKTAAKVTPNQTEERPKDWDLTYPYDREGNRVDEPTPLYKMEPKTEPTQLDRIESLLIELVQTNRKLHPNISDLMGGFQTRR